MASQVQEGVVWKTSTHTEYTPWMGLAGLLGDGAGWTAGGWGWLDCWEIGLAGLLAVLGDGAGWTGLVLGYGAGWTAGGWSWVDCLETVHNYGLFHCGYVQE